MIRWISKSIGMLSIGPTKRFSHLCRKRSDIKSLDPVELLGLCLTQNRTVTMQLPVFPVPGTPGLKACLGQCVVPLLRTWMSFGLGTATDPCEVAPAESSYDSPKIGLLCSGASQVVSKCFILHAFGSSRSVGANW